jgi:hypothetical protein
MADPALLPPTLRDERCLAFLQLAEAAAAMDLAQTRVQWIDQAPIAALPALALQSGMLDDPGWLLATTDAERRALLLEAPTLQRRRGTPWSIQRALALSGWPGITFQERLPPRRLDGTWLLDGVVVLDQENNWALFRALQPLPEKPITEANLGLITRLINAWKPLRCHLDALAFSLTLASHLRSGLLDGSWNLDGSVLLVGVDLKEVAEARFGARGLAHTIPIPSVDDSQSQNGWVTVTFEIDALTAVGEDLDTFALVTAQGVEIVRATRQPITKVPGLSLECIWSLDLRGRIA